jgi:phosphopantetheinyl transferase (holo-ACP synthase)
MAATTGAALAELAIGNDLVHFASNPLREGKRHQRYLQKTFSLAERAAITASQWPFLPLLLWSAKEAAYKAYMQLARQQQPFYAPKKFVVACHALSNHRAIGEVHFEAYTFSFFSSINAEFLHTVAVPLSQYQSSFALKVYSSSSIERENIKWRDKIISICKSSRGIPQLWQNGQCLTHPVSISHDGPYEALVIGKT